MTGQSYYRERTCAGPNCPGWDHLRAVPRLNGALIAPSRGVSTGDATPRKQMYGAESGLSGAAKLHRLGGVSTRRALSAVRHLREPPFVRHLQCRTNAERTVVMALVCIRF